jgi:hypothetical protein
MGSAETALAAFLFLTASTALSAEPPAPASCTASDVALPPYLAGWAKPQALTAGILRSALPQAVASTGYAVMLAPVASVAYGTPPGKAPAPGSYGGMLSVEIADAGTYVAALAAPAWIDVVKDGKPLDSTAHSHGPDCSTIRKLVEFSLEPGRYTIQLAGSPAQTIRFMIARKP